jgi:hypothetical protein
VDAGSVWDKDTVLRDEIKETLCISLKCLYIFGWDAVE